MFGHQTHVVFAAPTCAAMSCKCRQASTKSVALFLLVAVVPHGFQLPFISASHRRKKGWAQARACRNHVVSELSYLPRAMSRRGTVPELMLTSSRSPCARILRCVLRKKLKSCFHGGVLVPQWTIETLLPAWDSKSFQVLSSHGASPYFDPYVLFPSMKAPQ